MARRMKPIAVCLILLFQSSYVLFLAVKPAQAQAGIPGAVVINEFSSDTALDWVELYNTTAGPIDVTGWQLRNSDTGVHAVNGTLGAHGFLLVNIGDFLSSTAGAIILADDAGGIINAVNYGNEAIPASTHGQSTARTINGGTNWAVGTPTPGMTNITDVVAPSVPVGGSPDNTARTTRAFEFTWQPSVDPDGGSVQYEFRASHSANGEGAPVYGPLAMPAISFESLEGAGDGQWFWQVRALDGAGNRSAWSEIWQVVVDTNGPVLNIAQPGSSGLFGGPLAPQVMFSATINDERGTTSPRLWLDETEVTDQMVLSGDSIQRTVTANLAVSQLIDGQHVLRLFAIDGVGNSSEMSRSFEVDKTAPILSVNLRNNQVLKGIVTIDASAEDAHLSDSSISILDGQDEIIILDDVRTEATNEEDQVQNALQYDWDTNEVPDGTYRIRIVGIDAAGNKTELTRTVIVDNIILPLALGSISVDPLLDQLSKQLAQPFATPAIYSPVALPEDATEKVKDADIADPIAGVRETDRNAASTPVAPSEDGWRLFGIAWYWWLLLGLAGGFVFRQFRVVARRSVVSSLS